MRWPPFCVLYAARLVELLKKGQLEVQVEHHGGGHELGGPQVLQKIVAFIKAASTKA